MAQDISDKIRAAAQARGVDPELAVRIAMAESSLDPSAKAKKSSAAGLFQVTDDTWKQYGGKPGKKLDADENIRVGLEIIAANTNNLKNTLGREPRFAEVYAAHYFGPNGAKSVLTAPSDQAIDQLLSKSALRANPNLKGKTASQVLAQLEGKVGTAPRAAVPRETVEQPDPAQQQMERAFQSGISAQAPAAAPAPAVPRETTVAKADLSPSYQAALALSVLSDESEKEDRDPDNSPSIAQQWLEQQASRPTALADLGEIKIRSPFLDKPVMMNSGGEVKEPGLLSVPGYSETVAREMYPGEQGQFDRQDAARHMLASGTLSRKYGPTAAEMLGNLHEITTSPFRWVGSKLGISQMPIDYEQDLHNNRVGIELAKRSRSQKELEDLIQQAAEAAKGSQMEGTAWIGRPQRPVKRAEGSPKGGETAEPTPEELERASRPAFVTPKSGIGRKISATSGQINDATLQGLSEMPYNLVGSVADVGTLVLRPFGYQDKAPIMGSDWIKEQMTRLGVRPEPPKEPAARAVYEASQLASNLINPTAPVRGAIAAGKAGSKAASEMLQDFQAYNRQLTVPGASYITRPAGGEFPSAPKGQPSRSNLDEYIERLTKSVKSQTADELPPEKAEAAVEFLDKKLRSYFRSQAGSVSDPVREAIISGNIKFKKDTPEEEMFPQALIEAARKGDVTAMRALERSYDTNMRIQATRLQPKGESYIDTDAAHNAYSQAILEQMKNTPSLIPDAMLLRLTTKNADTLSPADAAKRVADIRTKMAENPTYFSVVLEPKMERLLTPIAMRSTTQEQMESVPHLYRAMDYAVKNPGQGIGALGTTERPVLDIYDTYMSPLRLQPEEIRDVFSEIPVKDLQQMSVPEFFAKAVAHKGKSSELEEYITRAGKLVRADKPVPPKIAFFGTKEFIKPDAQGMQGMQWREITDPAATRLHGEMLNNSIGGYSRKGTYGALSKGRTSLEQGDVRLFGLYDKDNRLVTNVEYVTPKANFSRANSITQFYGNGPRTGNVLPENYLPQVELFVRTLNPDKIPPRIQKLFVDNNIIF